MQAFMTLPLPSTPHRHTLTLLGKSTRTCLICCKECNINKVPDFSLDISELLLSHPPFPADGLQSKVWPGAGAKLSLLASRSSDQGSHLFREEGKRTF